MGVYAGKIGDLIGRTAMSALTTRNVKIAGVAACVPKRVEENVDLPFFADREEAEKVISSTGIA